jgi:hypothetical protein
MLCIFFLLLMLCIGFFAGWKFRSRIQTGVNYKTFTIRNKRKSGARTEYEKRKIAIEKGYLYPYLTVQAYVTDSAGSGLTINKRHYWRCNGRKRLPNRRRA